MEIRWETRKRLILHETGFPCLKFFTSYSIDGIRICWKWPYSLFRLLNNFSVQDWLLVTWGPFRDILTIQNRSELESQVNDLITSHDLSNAYLHHVFLSYCPVLSRLQQDIHIPRFVAELIEYACINTRKSIQEPRFERKIAETWWTWRVISIVADITACSPQDSFAYNESLQHQTRFLPYRTFCS